MVDELLTTLIFRTHKTAFIVTSEKPLGHWEMTSFDSKQKWGLL
jgi:hypothetical protein